MTGAMILTKDCRDWPFSLEAVIWDWDGTVADTLPHAFLFWKKICEEHGKPFPLKDLDHVRREMHEDFREFYDGVLGFDFNKEDVWIKPAFKEFMASSDICLRTGVEEVWRYCRSLGLAQGIASANLEEVIRPRLSALGVPIGPDGLIQSIVGYRPGIAPKPSPAALLECARQLGVHPYTCLYVGDTCADIVAARSAGMRCAIISGGFSTPEKMAGRSPDFYVSEPDELYFFIKPLVSPRVRVLSV